MKREKSSDRGRVSVSLGQALLHSVHVVSGLRTKAREGEGEREGWAEGGAQLGSYLDA